MFSWAVNYRYVLDGRLLSEYPMEQQAQIIADHFTLQAEGYGTWCDMRRDGDITLDGNMSEYVIRSLYTSTLRGSHGENKSLSLSFCFTALPDVTDRMPRTRGLLSV